MAEMSHAFLLYHIAGGYVLGDHDGGEGYHHEMQSIVWGSVFHNRGIPGQALQSLPPLLFPVGKVSISHLVVDCFSALALFICFCFVLFP